eukprot:2548676-Rhodomonas_salina.1
MAAPPLSRGGHVTLGVGVLGGFGEPSCPKAHREIKGKYARSSSARSLSTARPVVRVCSTTSVWSYTTAYGTSVLWDVRYGASVWSYSVSSYSVCVWYERMQLARMELVYGASVWS